MEDNRKMVRERSVMANDIFERIKKLPLDFNLLANSKVLIAGLGSGGNEIALDLAKCGVGSGKDGEVILVDNDKLEVVNLSRYTACDGIKDIGKYKVDVVADKLREYSPDINILPYPMIFEDFYTGHKSAFNSLNLIISAIGDFKSNIFINRCALKTGIPVVYGGVWKEAFGGEVIRVIPNMTPCYDCIIGQGSFLAEINPPEPDYGTDLSAEPGLGIDVRFVSIVQSKVALLTLLGNYDLPTNYIFVGNRQGWIFKRPFEILFVEIKRREDCETCKKTI